MCLAIPGKIEKINNENQNAIIDYDGIKKEANISLIECKVGDYVLIHAGFAIEIINEDKARDMYNLLYEANKNQKEK